MQFAESRGHALVAADLATGPRRGRDLTDLARTLTTVDGARLAYWLCRLGPRRRLIVLVHGLASNATRWTEFARERRLRESWDLLRQNLRGFEDSLYRVEEAEREGPFEALLERAI